MLGYPSDLEDMLFNKHRLIEHIKPGTVLVDHTTSSPSLAKKIAKACEEKKAFALDAPVTGGDVGAMNGELLIMVGGP